MLRPVSTPFSSLVVVRLGRTDSAGVWYFTEALDLAHEVFEEFLSSSGAPLHLFLAPGSVRLPIVHAEADFRAPVRCGDSLRVSLAITSCTKRSFSVVCDFQLLDGTPVASTRIVHAGAAASGSGSADLPESLLQALGALA